MNFLIAKNEDYLHLNLFCQVELIIKVYKIFNLVETNIKHDKKLKNFN